jgi:glycosyltransferase involved in cell wall biosynthesis
MRVALIGRYAVPFPYERHEVDHPMLARWARDLGRLDLFVLARDHSEPHWQDGALHVHYAPRFVRRLGPPGFLAWSAREVARCHREEPFDLLNGSDLWGGLVGLLLRSRLKCPVLAQVQGEFFPPDRTYYGRVGSPVLHVLARVVCARADAVRCLHDAASRQIIASSGASPERVEVIPSRCNVSLFTPVPQKNGAEEARPTVLFVGNLVRGKGVDELLDAFAVVSAREPRARLVLVGDGQRRAALVSRVGALGLGPRVEFRGRLPHRALPAIMASASLLVLPSHSEGTPRVILEAMAMELPVVATRVGGIPDIVDDGMTGLLVAPGDVLGLTAAIERVLKDRVWAHRAGVQGRNIVVARFSVERHVAQMINLQERCVRSWSIGDAGHESVPPPAGIA